MKRKLYVLLSIALVFFLIPTSIHAASFKDVAKNHWAKKYIDECVNEGLINGYPDNTFQPNGNVRFTEVSAMLARLINVSESEMQQASQQYSSIMNKYEMAKWAEQSILKLLYKGVFDEKIIKNAEASGMLKDGSSHYVNRANIARMMSMTLGVELETPLTYKDVSEISKDMVKYIGGLQSIGVLSKQGDENGKFRPNSGVTRAEMAKMLTVGLSYVRQNSGSTNNNSNNPIPTTPDVTTTSVSGHVTNIMTYNGLPTIILKTATGSSVAYQIDVIKQITVDGVPTLYTSIKEGMEATVLVANNKIQSGTFKTSIEEIEGTITKVGYNGKFDVEIKDGSITKTETFDFSDIKIKRDGKDVKYSDLRERDTLKITMIGTIVKSVDAKKGKVDFDGYFYSIEKDSYRDYIVRYTTEYNSSRTDYKRLYLDRDQYLYVDGRRISISDLTRNTSQYLVRGQAIKFKYDGYGDRDVNEIITVYDTDLKNGVITGYIVDDVRSSDDYIRISPKKIDRYWSSSDRYDDISIDNRTDIYFDSSRSRRAYTSDLRKNRQVRIELRDGKADRIFILTDNITSVSDKIIGDLYQINSRESKLDIDIDKRDQEALGLGEHELFAYDNSTTFYINGRKKTSVEFENYLIQKSQYDDGRFNPKPKIEFKYKLNGYDKYVLVEVNVIF